MSEFLEFMGIIAIAIFILVIAMSYAMLIDNVCDIHKWMKEKEVEQSEEKK